MNPGERDWLWIVAAGALALVAVAFALPASPVRAWFGLSTDANVPLKDVPEAVRAAAGRELGSLDDCKAARELEHGKVRWEFEKRVEGGVASVVLGDAGELLEIEKPVAFEALPKAVRDAVAQSFPNASIAHSEAIERRFVEVTLEYDGRTREVKVDLDGAIEQEAEPAGAPADAAKSDAK
jgi:hypothetical protein